MGTGLHRAACVTYAVIFTAAAVGLAACASSGDPPAGALFRADVGDISGGVAPGPHSVWYVQREPVRYVKMGFASWKAEQPRSGVRSWFARLFGHRRHAAAASGDPTAIASANLALPVPSRVQVTNVATGATVTVRVDDKGRLGDNIIQLAPESAHGLGADPGKPLLVRVRYLAPVIAYRERPTLALRGPVRSTPPAQAPGPTLLAAQSRPAPAAPAHAEAAIPEPPRAELIAKTPPPAPAPTAVLIAGGTFRVQAGAFASLDNAKRAVGMLQPAGSASIEPMKRGALTLYRVMVTGPHDAAAAERLRARVAAIGFADARLVRPL